MNGRALPGTGALIGALAATWLIEWLLYVIAFRRRPCLREGLAILAINAFTNPLGHAARDLAGVPFGLVEAGVVLVEIPLFRLLLVPGWRSAAACSVLLNGVTAVLSLVW
jgi:hypothetical protein